MNNTNRIPAYYIRRYEPKRTVFFMFRKFCKSLFNNEVFICLLLVVCVAFFVACLALIRGVIQYKRVNTMVIECRCSAEQQNAILTKYNHVPNPQIIDYIKTGL